MTKRDIKSTMGAIIGITSILAAAGLGFHAFLEGVERTIGPRSYFKPEEVITKQIYGDETPEIIVTKNGREYIFTQRENGSYIIVEELLQSERDQVEKQARNDYRTKLSQIEKKARED